MNGRKQTEETKLKISETNRIWFANLKKDPVRWYEYRKKQAEITAKRHINKEDNRKKYLLKTDFESLGEGAKRDRIILEQNGKCAKCGIDEWQGIKLTLEIDHINGDHTDNRRENLIALCPNCHSVTPTWRGRNKKSCNRVSDEAAIQALKSEPTIRQALVKCGLAPKGGNYKRFTRLKNNIDNKEITNIII